MGITRVGTREAEGFEAGIDSTEYHDTLEEPTQRDETGEIGDNKDSTSTFKLGEFQGVCGSSSLKECIELLKATIPKALATCRSGSSHQAMDPTHN